MADVKVLEAQQWVNHTYQDVPGYEPVEEDGKTGWQTMYALTMGLQYELGISPVVANFGPGTLSRLQSHGTIAEGESNGNIVDIVQYALFAKGYWGGAGDGNYGEATAESVAQLKQDMGVAGALPGSGVEPKVFKALLNMDPYVKVSGGTDDIRAIQQWMNGRYVDRRNFFVIPADGRYSRSVAKAMIYAVQYEIGMSDDVANGVFGPGTRDGVKDHTLSVGSSGTWVRLFTAAMIFNQRSGVSFAGTYTSSLATSVRTFQSFAGLAVNGSADFRTWASLLISYGDQSRPGTACDCVTEITDERGQALKAAGYKYVGRYLSNVPGTDLDKMLKPGEPDRIAEYGMSCFPIYQTYGRSADYFSHNQGTNDAYDAIEWAKYHGFRSGTRIYFAVDFDALDYQVTSNVLPHFKGIDQVVHENSDFEVGIYAPRNVCSRVGDSSYAGTSFVSDMSSGFSGNLGYPLPTNWAFDQIVTISTGSGDGYIEIDKDVASGRDTGQNVFDWNPTVEGLDVSLDDSYHDAMLQEAQTYLESIGVPETGGDGWTDDDWATLGGISTTKAFELVTSADWLFTSLARSLRMRKALFQAPVMWELRKINPLDFAADEAVEHGLKDDCSTGWGQIFARVAITARNYCVQQGIINGAVLDPDDDLKAVWDKLQDPLYNIKTAAYLTIYDAHDIGLGRPALDTSVADSQKMLARYNGTGDDAQQYGQELVGLYQVLEKYYRMMRTA